MILFKPVVLAGIIHIEKSEVYYWFILSVAPRPMQNTFRAHDDHVICVNIDTRIAILHSPAQQENKLKSNTNGLLIQARHVSANIP